MIRRFRSFICANMARFSLKVLIRVILSALLVSIIFYLKTVFFPDFSFLQVAYCVNVNDIAVTTITPNPIEIHFIAGSDAIRMASISNSSTVYEPTPEPSLLEEGGVIEENDQPRSNFYYICPTVTLYVGAGIAVVSWTTFILYLLGVG